MAEVITGILVLAVLLLVWRRRFGTGLTQGWIAVIASAAVVGMTSMAAASAAPHSSPPATVIGPSAGIAGQVLAAKGPPSCFKTGSGFPDCTSSDPQVSFGVVSNGDTSGCTFMDTTDWGDGTSTSKPVDGGSDGSLLTTFEHLYANPRTYPIAWTSVVTVNSGSCVSNSANLKFTLRFVGIYSDFHFAEPPQVTDALSDDWHLIADISGLSAGANCKGDYTKPTGNDKNVENELSAWLQDHKTHVPWLSFWTVDAPPPGRNAADVGLAEGRAAATEVEHVASRQATRPVLPAYIILDPEGSPCGNPAIGKDRFARIAYAWDHLSRAKWKALVGGWDKGVTQVSSDLSPAVYLTAFQYGHKGGSDYGHVFVAAHAKHGSGLPAEAPIPVRGHPNIVGYNGFYANCDDAAPDIIRVQSWGAPFNTLQFSSHSEICAP